MEIKMQISLSNKFRITPTLIILAITSLVFSLASSFLFGELMLPLSTAALAALFVLEGGRRRIFSIAVPLLAIAADLIIHGTLSYLALEATVLAIVIALFFLQGSKAECAFWLTLTVSLFVVFAMVLAAYQATGAFDFDAFIDYYISLYETVEEWFTELFREVIASYGDAAEGIDPSMASTLLGTMASVIPSTIMIFGFAVAGVSLKIFSRILRTLCDVESRAHISAWRFVLPTPIYVAFWVAALLNLFVGLSGASSMFSIVVLNVYNLLLYVFVYIGFGVVIDFLTALFKKRSLAILVTVGAFILFSTLAVELIAYFGASVVFYRKRGIGGKNL